MKRLKVMLVAGARPNFMKISPLIKEISKYPQKFDWFLVHTGQHYDEEMSDSFLKDLRIAIDTYLGIGSGTPGEQVGKIMVEFEKTYHLTKPDLIIVVGDVNSTLACALVAAKLSIPLAHVEAGLRSFDSAMPEEMNRIITDHLSDYLFTTCEDANKNLIDEGIQKDKIFFVGNTMIDCLLSNIKNASKSTILEKLKLRENGCIKKYGIVTLHRPSNVDDPVILRGILDGLSCVSFGFKVVFPIHPRTMKQIEKHMLYIPENIMTTAPLGYLDFLSLMSNATIVLTDSGGIQEETTVLGIPCLTLRDNTERSITIREGTNILVGNYPDEIFRVADSVLRNGMSEKKIPKYWDGKAAERIIGTLISEGG